MTMTWWQGYDADRRHLHIDADPYTDGGKLRIDGEEMAAVSVDRLRDGGTTILRWGMNTLVLRRKRHEPPSDWLNGHRLTPVDEGWQRWHWYATEGDGVPWVVIQVEGEHGMHSVIAECGSRVHAEKIACALNMAG